MADTPRYLADLLNLIPLATPVVGSIQDLRDIAVSAVPSGRAVTLTVAASDAPLLTRVQADYVCDGVADEVQINAALVAANGGTVVLTDGEYTTAAPIVITTADPSSLLGQGKNATFIQHPVNVNGINWGDRSTTNLTLVGSRLGRFTIQTAGGASTDIGINGDGLEQCIIEDVYAYQHGTCFKFADYDRCTAINLNAYSFRAQGYSFVQKDPSVGNGHASSAGFMMITCDFVITDNSTVGALYTQVGGSTNRIARHQWIGGMHYADTAATGSVGHKFTLGANVHFLSTLFENTLKHVVVDAESHITFDKCEFLRFGSNSTVGVEVNAYATIEIDGCIVQRMDKFLNATAGFPELYAYGRTKNDGNITTIVDGSWAQKGGTDTGFFGTDVLALGASASPFAIIYGRHADTRSVQNISGAAVVYPGNGGVSERTLTGNVTSFSIDTGIAGERLTLSLIQDGTGSRTWASVTGIKFAGAAAPTLTTTAGRRDVFNLYYDGTSWVEISRAMNVG